MVQPFRNPLATMKDGGGWSYALIWGFLMQLFEDRHLRRKYLIPEHAMA